MNRNQLYSHWHKASSILMLLALAWLTVSLPFVYQSQQMQRAQVKETKAAQQDDNTNPLANTTEEKTENGPNTLSEYLHDMPVTKHPVCFIVKAFHCHATDLHVVYPPELLSPPPEA
jgi:hypothetical protein